MEGTSSGELEQVFDVDVMAHERDPGCRLAIVPAAPRSLPRVSCAPTGRGR